MRLTSLARGGGCGCKLGRSALAEALALVPQAPDPDVLAGFDRAEDAAVYRVRDDLAIVASVDFFTPIVDDPATFGAIAATNALSDLHAMGASPVLALAVAAYPDDADPRDLAVLMRAGAEAALADGCPVLGGHTIADPEPKYGLAVVGTVHPERILSNAAGTPGDLLILTKPLGTGVIVTAQKAGWGDPVAMEAAVATMLASNRPAAEAAREGGVRCATDVTGFGLRGPPVRDGLGERGGRRGPRGERAAAARGPRAGGARRDDRRRAAQPGLRRPARGRLARRAARGRGRCCTIPRRAAGCCSPWHPARRTGSGASSPAAGCPTGRSAGSATGRPAASP